MCAAFLQAKPQETGSMVLTPPVAKVLANPKLDVVSHTQEHYYVFKRAECHTVLCHLDVKALIPFETMKVLLGCNISDAALSAMAVTNSCHISCNPDTSLVVLPCPEAGHSNTLADSRRHLPWKALDLSEISNSAPLFLVRPLAKAAGSP